MQTAWGTRPPRAMRHLRPPFWRLIGVALLLVGAALACNLSTSGARPTATPTFVPPTPVPTQPPLVTPAPTQFVIYITATPFPSTVPQYSAATPFGCVPYTAWPVYTVVAGDTLGQIAQRTGATLQQLTTANCLASAELIYVGQRLYVPRLPLTTTSTLTLTFIPTWTRAPMQTAVPTATSTAIPTANANLPVFSQPLSADQHWRDSGGWAVTYYPTVRVTVGVVQNADAVNFYVDDPASSRPISIGQDADPWDGAYVDYTFPAPGSYTFEAVAQNESGTVNSTVFTIRYDPSFVPPGGQRNTLSVTPSLSFSGGTYTLRAGTTVTITWADAPIAATRVDFTLTRTSGQAQAVGFDLSPQDGASTTWSVPGGVTGQLQANASMPDGSVVSSEAVGVVSQ
jgi:hypothetical protein